MLRGRPIEETMLYRHASVGVICFSMIQNELYFLLGKETTYEARRSGRWCDFGGKPNPGETYVQTASREFTEEGLATIYVTSEHHLVDHNVVSYQSMVHDLLSEHQYYCSFKLKIDNVLRIYFVIRIPWQPESIQLFSKRKQLLLRCHGGAPKPYVLKFSPAYAQNKIRTEFMEKSQLAYWHVDRIKEVIQRKSFRYYHHFFRPSFIHAMTQIIDIMTPGN